MTFHVIFFKGFQQTTLVCDGRKFSSKTSFLQLSNLCFKWCLSIITNNIFKIIRKICKLKKGILINCNLSSSEPSLHYVKGAVLLHWRHAKMATGVTEMTHFVCSNSWQISSSISVSVFVNYAKVLSTIRVNWILDLLY
jgi:hypothetical protein